MFVGHTSWQDGKWTQEGSQLLCQYSMALVLFSENINAKSEALFSTTLTLEQRGPQPQDFELNFQANFGKAVAVRGGGRQHGHFRPRFLHHLLRESGSVRPSLCRSVGWEGKESDAPVRASAAATAAFLLPPFVRHRA